MLGGGEVLRRVDLRSTHVVGWTYGEATEDDEHVVDVQALEDRVGVLLGRSQSTADLQETVDKQRRGRRGKEEGVRVTDTAGL